MAAWDELVLDKLLVRYADLIPDGAGLDAPSAGGPAHRREFNIVGGTTVYPGVDPGPARRPDGFVIAGLRQSVCGAAAPTFCDVAEVFIAHVGRWRIELGPNGEDEGVELAPGDVVSVPVGAYRRLEKLDDQPGFLFVVRGTGVDPVPTAVSAVFGTSLDEQPHLLAGGRWIDHSGGLPVLRESSPDAAVAGPASSAAGAAGTGLLSQCTVVAAAVAGNPESPLAAAGVEESAVVAPRATRDRFEPGPITGWWPHGFSIRCLTLSSGTYVPMHSRGEWEILLLQEGTLEVSWAGGAVMMGAGDTLTVPVGLMHAFRNTTSTRTRAFAVRGSEDPAMPLFQSMPPHG